jgi:iron complex outermembrane receptor protein
MVNAAVQRKVLNNKGTLKLALTNLFQSQDITGKIKMGNAYADFRNYQLSRGAMLSFVYRFGKPIKGMNGQKNNASDVQGRIKLD